MKCHEIKEKKNIMKKIKNKKKSMEEIAIEILPKLLSN